MGNDKLRACQEQSGMYYVYILASRRNGTLYVGFTDNLSNRICQHRTGVRSGFASRYRVYTLVWFERYDARHDAFVRERQIKEWRRSWKLRLIEGRNPGWRDLFDDFMAGSARSPYAPVIPAKAGIQLIER
jgi:putative endonuclease